MVVSTIWGDENKQSTVEDNLKLPTIQKTTAKNKMTPQFIAQIKM